MIVVDNTLWSGTVADPSVQDEDTRAIRAFNDAVHRD
jgi:caffeoyl-CoA O-methyltransferase